MSNKQNLTLLSVLAHPDDESFGMGGTLALYANQGVNVQLICATRGEAGEVKQDFLNGYRSISELREAELSCAAKELGISDVHFLDYRDSGMQGSQDNLHPDAFCRAPLEEIAQKITLLIRKLKPQIVLTFDPIGGYRHPDHITIHQATVLAFNMAGDDAYKDDYAPFAPQKLYFHTISRKFIRAAVRILKLLGKDPSRWGENEDIDLTTLMIDDFPIHARIEYRDYEKVKLAASSCHASQISPAVSSGPIRWILRFFSRKDTFMRAYPPPVPGDLEKDLFSGIN